MSFRHSVTNRAAEKAALIIYTLRRNGFTFTIQEDIYPYVVYTELFTVSQKNTSFSSFLEYVTYKGSEEGEWFYVYK